MRIIYAPKKFTREHQQIIYQATSICEEYADAGIIITLRQLYYQFVARGLMANKQTEYKRLGDIINDARMAGELDWEFLVDRTRNLIAPNTWSSPGAMLKQMAKSYTPDLWKDQHHRIEVWIEKDAGISVIEGVCDDNSIPYFACRGYVSASELWNAAQRIGNHLVRGNRVTILHIGDHDPSGLDMTRDMRERLATFIANDWYRSDTFAEARWMFTEGGASTNEAIRMHQWATIIDAGGEGGTGSPWRLKRIALNHDQVLQYEPPPNPAKTTDSRFIRYMEQTGLDESWELDALDPFVLQTLIQEEIDAVRNEDLWAEANLEMTLDRAALVTVSDNWAAVRAEHTEDNTEES